jgi:hypothetical protein
MEVLYEMKKLFKRKKKMNLDTNSLAEAAQNKVSEAFIMFKQAHDAVEEAQQELTNAFQESYRKIDSLKGQLKNEEIARQKVADQFDANQKLKEQLKPFIQ